MKIKEIVGFIQSLLPSLPSDKKGEVDDNQEKPSISNKWRQGDILSDELARNIIQRLEVDTHCSPLRDFSESGIFVLISQDCDLVQPSYEKEPFAEAIWGYIKDDSKYLDPNSPRAICLSIEDSTSATRYIFEDRNRVVFPRHWLQGEPTGNQMDDVWLRRLIRMVIRRYDRQPLPSEFNKRLGKRGGKVSDKIIKLLQKCQEELSGITIYLRLSSWKEPTDEEPIESYKVYPLAIYRLDLNDSGDESRRRQAADELMNGKGDEKNPNSYLALGLIGLLQKCESHGIEVLDSEALDDTMFANCDHVLSERQFTLDHRHEFRPWEFDFLSPDEQDSTPLSPHSQ